MKPSPKEIHRSISSRKRQHEADLAKSPSEMNRRLSEIAAEKGVLSVKPSDETVSLVSSEAKEWAAVPTADTYGQPGQGSVAGTGEMALGHGDGDLSCFHCGGIGWFSDQDGDRADCPYCYGSPTPKLAKAKRRRLGRLPHGSRFETDGYNALTEKWTVRLAVYFGPQGREMKRFEVLDTSVHAALETLWDCYCEWKAAEPVSPQESV